MNKICDKEHFYNMDNRLIIVPRSSVFALDVAVSGRFVVVLDESMLN
jgi:hypothetical protein